MTPRFVVSWAAMQDLSTPFFTRRHKAHLLAMGLALPLLFAGCYSNVFGSQFETCEELYVELEDELSSLQACSADAECGQILEGTSCGCTNELVARKEFDTTRFRGLQRRGDELGCTSKTTDCVCPVADGFVCTGGVCGWKHVP